MAEGLWIVFEKSNPARNGAVKAASRGDARTLGRLKFIERGIRMDVDALDATAVYDGESLDDAKARVAALPPQ